MLFIFIYFFYVSHRVIFTWHGPVGGVLLVFGALIALESCWQSALKSSGTQHSSRLLDEGRSAADCSSNASALVEWAGLEGVSVIIVSPIQVTTNPHHVCKNMQDWLLHTKKIKLNLRSIYLSADIMCKDSHYTNIFCKNINSKLIVLIFKK